MNNRNHQELILGNHLILDLFECDYYKINNIDIILNILHKTISRIGATLISEGYKEFSPIGISVFAIISESHISIHTWPEYNFAAVDIFSCNKKLTKEVCVYIKQELNAQSTKINILKRGKLELEHR